MRRTAFQIFAAVLAAGIIGTALTVLLWDDDEPLAVDTSPTPTGSVTPPPLTLPTATPTPTGSPAPSATPSESPTATPAPQPPPARQHARDVDCDRTPTYCSSTTGTMEVSDDKLVRSGTIQHSIDYSSVPDTTMTWHITREGGGGDARNGDDVETLEVAVEIRNDTNSTWVIPNREVALIVTVDEEKVHELVTEGGDFVMRPGGSITARYTIPIAFEGKYEWRAKTWFYQR